MEVNETRTEPFTDRGLGDDERYYEEPAAARVILRPSVVSSAEAANDRVSRPGATKLVIRRLKSRLRFLLL